MFLMYLNSILPTYIDNQSSPLIIPNMRYQRPKEGDSSRRTWEPCYYKVIGVKLTENDVVWVNTATGFRKLGKNESLKKVAK